MIEHAGDTTLTQVYNLRKSRKKNVAQRGISNLWYYQDKPSPADKQTGSMDWCVCLAKNVFHS